MKILAAFAKEYWVSVGILFLLCAQATYAGPPFNTDDPDPVEYKHWEFYISTINTFRPTEWTGTCPHFEMNYGLVQNVQVHLITPLNYDATSKEVDLGYAYTEVGMKYRFVKETKSTPEIGTFPIIEIPTIKNDKFSNGSVQVYLPLWLQKSWDKLTTYGGAGYWINPGSNNRNWLFAGWELQYDISKVVTLGGELYFQSANAVGSKSSLAFNFGGIINASEKTHFIFSVGHSIINDNFFTAYAGIQWTVSFSRHN